MFSPTSHTISSPDAQFAAGISLNDIYNEASARRRLSEEIISRSESKEFETAQKEWKLHDIYQTSEGICLCGKQHIVYMCVLKNDLNENIAEVGHDCATRITEEQYGPLFESLNRIKEDPKKRINDYLIQLAFEHGFVSEWEKGFLENTKRKIKLTEKQQAVRIKLNQRIVKSFTRIFAGLATITGDQNAE